MKNQKEIVRAWLIKQVKEKFDEKKVRTVDSNNRPVGNGKLKDETKARSL